MDGLSIKSRLIWKISIKNQLLEKYLLKWDKFFVISSKNWIGWNSVFWRDWKLDVAVWCRHCINFQMVSSRLSLFNFQALSVLKRRNLVLTVWKFLPCQAFSLFKDWIPTASIFKVKTKNLPHFYKYFLNNSFFYKYFPYQL